MGVYTEFDRLAIRKPVNLKPIAVSCGRLSQQPIDLTNFERDWFGFSDTFGAVLLTVGVFAFAIPVAQALHGLVMT